MLLSAGNEVGVETNTEKTMRMDLKQVICMKYTILNQALQKHI